MVNIGVWRPVRLEDDGGWSDGNLNVGGAGGRVVSVTLPRVAWMERRCPGWEASDFRVGSRPERRPREE